MDSTWAKSRYDFREGIGGEPEYQKLLRDYLDSVTLIEKIAIYLEAIVNYLRNRIL
ncbi:MAG: hypothetical protein F6K47_21725 [Symploca sp. SIO2E6]|nr:hypothetical protein [Symploca sp. SIO2E6]